MRLMWLQTKASHMTIDKGEAGKFDLLLVPGKTFDTMCDYNLCFNTVSCQCAPHAGQQLNVLTLRVGKRFPKYGICEP